MTDTEDKLPLLIAQRIAMNIHGHKASDNEAFVASVYGEWGVGKTRCLKEIQNAFDDKNPSLEYQKDNKDNSDPFVVTVFFSPWKYEKEEHLIVPLLRTIENALLAKQNIDELEANDETKEKWTKITTIIKGLAKAVAIASLPMVEKTPWLAGIPASLPFDDIIKSTQEYLRGLKETDKTPIEKSTIEQAESLYFDFNKQLQTILQQEFTIDEQQKILRFVILIDDLDRCLPEKSIEMLESIKLFMNVRGISFVLAVDDDIVERGIRHRYADYLKNNDKQSQDSNNPQQLPITGHEYLEKIVHLPINLSRLDEEKAKKLFYDSCGYMKELYPQVQEDSITKKLDGSGIDSQHEKSSIAKVNKDEILDLVVNCIPLVPRKIIRLAETLDFQYQSLKTQCRKDTDDEQQLRQIFHPLAAVRTIILAQIYPEVYRILRKGNEHQFWQRLFYLRHSSKESGVMVYANDYEIALARQNNNSKEKNEPIELLECTEQELHEHINTSTLKSETEINKDKKIGFLNKQKNNREILEIMQTARKACQNRTGWGLLKLWNDNQREIIINNNKEISLIATIVGNINNPFPMKKYRQLFLDLIFKPIDKSQEKQPVKTTEEKELFTIESQENWLKAIFGDEADRKEYLKLYRQQQHPVDDASFTALLARFLKLSMEQRQQLSQDGWLDNIKDLIGIRQLQYLQQQIVPVNKKRFDKNNNELKDNETGLTWKRDCESEKMTWQDAQVYAKKYKPWRLPTVDELFSIVNYSKNDPAIDETNFPNMPSDWIWTSSPAVGGGGHAWVVSFDNGVVVRGHVVSGSRVLLVRS